MSNQFGVTEKGFVIKRYDDILYDLQQVAIAEFGNDINLSDSSPLGKYLKVIAWEESLLWEDFENSYYQLHLLHAGGNSLDMWGSNFGDERKQGTKAKGQITIQVNDSITLEKGFKVSTLDNLVFETVKTVQLIKGKATIVDIIATENGTQYNVDSESITRVVNPILGIVSVTNETKTYGGSDLELDIEYRERLKFNRRTPLTGDNPNQYIYWAKEVAGVGSVKVIRAYPKVGFVTLIITDNKGQSATEELIKEVEDYIEEVKPVNAGINIQSAKTKQIIVSVELKISNNYSFETITNNIKESIEDYFKSIALEQDYISHAKISSLIFGVDGVIDHDNLLLNDEPKNLEIDRFEIPVLKSLKAIEIKE